MQKANEVVRVGDRALEMVLWAVRWLWEHSVHQILILWNRLWPNYSELQSIIIIAVGLVLAFVIWYYFSPVFGLLARIGAFVMAVVAAVALVGLYALCANWFLDMGARVAVLP